MRSQRRCEPSVHGTQKMVCVRRRYMVFMAIASVLLPVCVWMVFAGQPRRFRRPLFHKYVPYSGRRNPLDPWGLIYPVSDGHGTYAFFDPELNLVVVIASDHVGDGSFIPLNATPRQAVLLPGGNNETHVGRASDTLIVAGTGSRWASAITPGSAEVWHDMLFGCMYGNGNAGGVEDFRVLSSLVELYDGPDANGLKAAIRIIEQKRVEQGKDCSQD